MTAAGEDQTFATKTQTFVVHQYKHLLHVMLQNFVTRKQTFVMRRYKNL